MKIISVTIKNVRGFQNRKIDLDMIPNKPSMIVAPNGTGKSSFAIAFNSLKPRSLHVDKDEIFSNNDTFIPELMVETDTKSFVANPSKNEIANEFSVFVINNQNKAKAVTNNIAGTRISTARMQVAPIVLIKGIPQDVVLNNTFIDDYGLQILVRGAIPSINGLLSNNRFLDGFDCSAIRPLQRLKKTIEEFINRFRTYTGRKVDIWNKILADDIPLLEPIEIIHSVVDYCRNYTQGEDEAVVYLKAIQLIMLCLKDRRSFESKTIRAKYVLERESYKTLFSSLKTTWKDVQPKEVGGNFIIEINDTEKISNGERDIIVFLATLQQARNALVKQNNILIIDEIFDYLDDANLIAAQYYIINFIEEIKAKGSCIFPIILSHLNPNYFKTYAFQDLKVYYLNPHKPMYSQKMEMLLNRRSELMIADKQNGTSTDLISKYLLHFHYDYTTDMGATYNHKPELNPWKDIRVFKNYCKSETDKYLNFLDYDSVAVCVWLRECIEKYIYDSLPVGKKTMLVDVFKTNKKIQFAEENGIICPEIFSMLGLIYNDSLHTDNKSKIDSREILYSRLENNTIREMIRKVVSDYPA